MYCEYCRAPMSDDATSCPSCGMLVRKIETPEPASDPRITQVIAADEIKAGIDQAEKQKKVHEVIAEPVAEKRTMPDMTGVKDSINDGLKGIASVAGGIGERAKEIKVDEIKGKFLDFSDKLQKEVNLGAPLPTALADGEVVVRKYNCADVKGVQGYLTVTNKRLMFNASGGQSRLCQEVTLSSVSGLTCYRGKNFLPVPIILGVLLALAGLMTMFSGGGYGYGYGGGGGAIAGLFMILIGAILIFMGIQTAFLVAVYAKDVSVSPIVVGEGPRSIVGNSALLAVASKATNDTDIMLSELGALVQDLQTMGDLAISKWQK